MDGMKNFACVEELAKKIEQHNHAYWVDHKPTISDEEYDEMVARLRQFAPSHPVLNRLVEDSKGGKAKIRHDVPMLSLDKVFTVEDVIKWADGCGAFAKGIVVSYKVDGSSCSLLYEGGRLVRAATRGNGKEGDDITPNAMVIAGIPHSISYMGKLEVRGEIYMSKASFAAATLKFENDLKNGKAKESDRPVNARNYCAGSIKQKDPRETAKRNLNFMAHNIVHTLPMADEDWCLTEEDCLKFVRGQGFEIPLFCVVTLPLSSGRNQIAEAIKEIEGARKMLPYGIDGVVFGVNDMSLHGDLGSTEHHPRYRLAFKFARERGETKIVAVHWATCRTGRVVPQIEMEPICLGDATVRFCTGHNAKNVLDNGLAPGATVLMEREVIPYLVERVKLAPDGMSDAPTVCPSCGTALAWDENKVDLVCPNMGGCEAQLLDYVCHYVSRGATNMMGIGESIVAKMLETKLVKSPADLYVLTEDMLLKAGVVTGKVSAKNIIEAIKARREQTLATFLYSLGVPDLGQTVAERVAGHFKTLDACLAANEEELRKVEGVGEKIAVAIKQGFASRKELISNLRRFVMTKDFAQAEGSLAGKSFCLSGKVEMDDGGKHYDTRPAIEELIRAKGGSIKGVSKGLDFLVAGPGSVGKTDKATALGVKIISGKDLEGML